MYLLHHLLQPRPMDGERIAIEDRDNGLTYSDFRAGASTCGARLRPLIEPGDRVGIYLPRSIGECVAIFGVSFAGGVFVPINPLLKPAQVRHILADCGARVLVTDATLRDNLGEALEGLADLGATVLIEELGDPDPCLAASGEMPPDSAIGEDLAAILYTSGSTGSPKGVMLNHRNLLAGARIVARYLQLGGDDRILSLLPFSFDYGLNQLLTAIQERAVLVVATFQLGNDIVAALAHHRITGLAGVPTIWTILAFTAPRLSTTPLPHLRYITNSGGALSADLVARLRHKLPQARLFLMYGLTEAFRSTYLSPEQIDRRPTSIGKAIPECEVMVVTSDGRRASRGEPGILVHRGPTVSLGYWNRPEDTNRVLRQHPFRSATLGGETVCYSGDLVVEDEDGFLFFVGRNDAMIKSAGYRISPTEVEAALMATGAFRQVAVIGIPDRLLGQRVHALAITRDGKDVDVVSILDALSDELASYMVPRSLELVANLPTNPNGKIDYKRLAAERANDANP